MATKVLIVENDTNTSANLCDILHTERYLTEVATNATDAIERISHSSFDLIIIDWHLPDMTADELLLRLRRQVPEVSVLVATGSADIEHAIHAMQHGASDYIVKPICPELLLGSMRRARKLQSAQRRAAQAERLAVVGNAVAAVAHESRNALQRIRSRVDLIRMMHPEDANLLEDLASIEDASAHLQLYFSELLQFTVPVNLKKQRCGLRDLVHRVWRNLQSSRAFAGAKLSVPNSDIQCLVDSIRIEQVMRNLFENAIAACDGVACIEVNWCVGSSHDEEAVLITVRDNGPGFSAEQRASAFEPFFTTKTHGSGMGLAICRRIIEGHGGTIEVEANVDCGAAILITLPTQSCSTAERSCSEVTASTERQAILA
jgi:signal transduction histidine kinase